MDYPGRIARKSSGKSNLLQSLLTSSWTTIVALLALAAIAAALLFAFIWYLSYGFNANAASTISLASVSSETRITWYENGSTEIEAPDLTSAMAALGVVHARYYGWEMTLLRQAARGGLTNWFGDSLLTLDRYSRRLRFASLARSTYDSLSPDESAWLSAYTEGINSILQEKQLVTVNEFALMDITPAAWEPWHSLAVERLLAWLSTDLNALPDTLSPSIHGSLDSLRANKESLHRWFQLHSFHHSMAGIWPADSTTGRMVFHRFIEGSSATSLSHETTLRIGSTQPALVVTIPGTLLMPSGLSQQSGWFILPTSSTHIVQVPSTLTPTRIHERLRKKDGTEVLLTTSHYSKWIPLENRSRESQHINSDDTSAQHDTTELTDTIPENTLEGVGAIPDTTQQSITPKDSLWVLQWNGMEKGTDISGYWNLWQGKKPVFHLLEGHGLLNHDSTWTILGDPPYVHELQGGILISGSPWTQHHANRLNQLLSSNLAVDPEYWPADCRSTWAEEHATFLIEDYLRLKMNATEPAYENAYTYLRNWDFSYGTSSIGATIFESWMQTLPDSLRRKVLSHQIPVSSNAPVVYLQQAIDSLYTHFGSDLSKWRLDITSPVYRSYPAWNADSLFSLPRTPLSQSIYAPLSFPGKGHASTLCWGSYLSEEGYTVSSRWESWTHSTGDTARFRWRKHQTPNTMLGRHLIASHPSTLFSYDENNKVKQTTVLKPVK